MSPSTIPAPIPRGASLPAVAPLLVETVQDRLFRQLRELIMQGRFQPGQRLKIQDIATAFGTSSQPVREALRQLVAERAVEALPNRGARIPALSADMVEDLRLTRHAVEGLAVSLAAGRATLADLDGLQRLVAAGDAADEAGDVDASLAANQAFHFTLYALSGSRLLPAMIERLWLQIGPYLRRSALGFDMRRGAGTRFHVAALAALRRGDAEAARAAIVADIDRSCDLLGACLREAAA